MQTPYTIRRSDEDGRKWVAHAVAFDLVNVSARKAEAIRGLRVCLIAQIAFAKKRGWSLRNCYFAAPVEYWDVPFEFMEMPNDAEIAECKIFDSLAADRGEGERT